MGGKIIDVLPGSVAEELGIAAGDILLSINGEPVRDLIDYNYWCDEEYLDLEIKKPSGEIWDCEVEKDEEEILGLVFSANVFDGIQSCANHCMFCFIDQLQPDPRPSLLLKDDDFRMSLLEGNFVTCTNMKEEDFQRIRAQHISPLYISVHTVDPMLRGQMLGRKKPAEILLTIQRLISFGCIIHGQVVLCPGVNDGVQLEKTIDALYALRSKQGGPGVASVAIVPVGLTKYQKSPLLRLYTPQETAALLDRLELRQQRYLAKDDNAFVFPADELYVRAGRPFPEAARYGDFCQIENGVGMASLFLFRFEQLKDKLPTTPPARRIGVVTGKNGAAVLRPVIAEICAKTQADLTLLELQNLFYGETISATGLLTGTCLLAGVPKGVYDRLLLPANMLKFDEDVFLDGRTPAEVAAELETEICVSNPDPAALLAAIFSPTDMGTKRIKQEK